MEEKVKDLWNYKELMFIMDRYLKSLLDDLETSDTVSRAAQRARVKTIKLQKMFKAFRKESVKHFKEVKANDKD